MGAILIEVLFSAIPFIATWILKALGKDEKIAELRLRWHKKLDTVMLASAHQADSNDRIDAKIKELQAEQKKIQEDQNG